MDKLIISDTHYHNHDRFSKTNDNGVNSRLQHIIDATVLAANEAQDQGIKVIIHAGDCFHVRGKISPTVLNPVIDLYSNLVDAGFQVYMIAGNHDLESRDSQQLTNTASALESVGVNVINETTIVEEIKCVFVPWQPSLSQLKQVLSDCATQVNAEEYSAFIHAPMNGVISNIPDNGIEPADLKSLGYKRIYCGHYHNHKDFGGVVSVGALTHQNFGDIKSKAGFVLEIDGNVFHRETQAPKFVDLDMADDVYDQNEFNELVEGNFVRARLEDADEKEIANLRSDLESANAAGILITSTAKKSEATARQVSASSTSVTIEQSVSSWVQQRGFTQHEKAIETAAIEILGEI